MAVMKIVLVCTRRDQYGMIFHALVIEFIQFVNLYQISLFHLLSRQVFFIEARSSMFTFHESVSKFKIL